MKKVMNIIITICLLSVFVTGCSSSEASVEKETVATEVIDDIEDKDGDDIEGKDGDEDVVVTYKTIEVELSFEFSDRKELFEYTDDDSIVERLNGLIDNAIIEDGFTGYRIYTEDELFGVDCTEASEGLVNLIAINLSPDDESKYDLLFEVTLVQDDESGYQIFRFLLDCDKVGESINMREDKIALANVEYIGKVVLLSDAQLKEEVINAEGIEDANTIEFIEIKGNVFVARTHGMPLYRIDAIYNIDDGESTEQIDKKYYYLYNTSTGGLEPCGQDALE